MDKQVMWLLLDVLLVCNEGIFIAWDQSSKADFKTIALVVLRPEIPGKRSEENKCDLSNNKVTSLFQLHYSDHCLSAGGSAKIKRNKKETKSKQNSSCYSLKEEEHVKGIYSFTEKPFIHQLLYFKISDKQWIYSVEEN